MITNPYYGESLMGEHEMVVTSDGMVTQNAITGMYTVWDVNCEDAACTTPHIFLARAAYKAYIKFLNWE